MASVNSSKVQKILVISLSNIGDIILTTPVISILRERFPKASLSVLVGPKGVPLFTNSSTVDEVICFDKHASWPEMLRLIFQLREKKFNLIVDLRHTAIPFLLQPNYRTSLFVDRSSTSMRQRHLDRLCLLLEVESCKNHFNFFTDEEKNSARSKLNRFSSVPGTNDFVVLAPGAGSALKRWTISGFVELTHYFLSSGKRVVLIGDEHEVDLGKELEEKVSKSVTNLIGLLTLRELAGLIHESSLVVANDSAVMHLAHELNRPTVSIFGPTNDKKYWQAAAGRKLVRLNLDCTPCEQAQCRLPRRLCLDDLPASLVIRACEELLNHVPH
ncbi:MAG: hypothetical protein A3C35_00580 [Omnitrophica bacterium RIFCSPHIGHO2_02_FULL_46_11]|nr:MAG: hypothetical protein A3C35_00580 [Omnitrophica bacterium RIFCSPHIGHO2_02_FULL_46_11]OGW87641.1 MAG: hypothetical protein A3A81_04845 [Omnitrophica bacterium RIFCSPLOWO2_01_FULL_45_10b]